MALSDQLASKVGTHTKKGTLITENLVNAVRADEAAILEIRENNAEQVKASIKRALMAALEEIGLVAEGKAKKLCPVDTGRLRNSITHAVQTDAEMVMIGTNVHYAPYVHNGVTTASGKKRTGVPFLTRAAENNKPTYRAIFEKHLRNG